MGAERRSEMRRGNMYDRSGCCEVREKLRAIAVIARQQMSVARAEQYIENLLAGAARDKAAPNVTTLLSSVHQTLTRIQQLGIGAVSERRETEHQIVLTITIPK